MGLQKLIHFSTIDSTNEYALRHIDTLPDYTLITADVQTIGRGRHQSAWYSSNLHNLYFSLVFKDSLLIPEYSNSKNFILSSDKDLNSLHTYSSNHISEIITCTPLIMATAIAKSLRDLGLNPSLKWPNDVLVDGKKIAGILAETSFRGNMLVGMIIGVGFNIRLSKDEINKIKKIKKNRPNYISFQTPDATFYYDEVVSLYQFRIAIDKKKMLNLILDKFFPMYTLLSNKGFSFLKKEYIEFCDFIGRKVKIVRGDTKICGEIRDINGRGELIVYDNFQKKYLSIV